jgi:hypothetical protein
MTEEIKSFASRSILYYPTLEFQSETWVKASLLFWEKIYRIVPANYKTHDSDEIKIAISNGFIEDIELTEKDLRQTADKFESFCNQLQFNPAGFDSRTYEVRLHTDKIDERLKAYFKQFSKDTDSQGFLRIPQEIANGYMFYLSDTVSKRRNIAKLTDNPDMYAAMIYFDGKGDFDELYFCDDKNPETYTNLMIERLIPKDIRSLNMEIVINLHKELETEKREFRKLVNEFTEKLSKIEDEKTAIAEIEYFKKTFLESKMTWQEKFKSLKQETENSLLYAGLPMFATSTIASLHGKGAYDLTELSKGLLISGVATIASVGKELRKKWTAKKSNYYLEIGQQLTSKENASIRVHNITTRLNEFVND